MKDKLNEESKKSFSDYSLYSIIKNKIYAELNDNFDNDEKNVNEDEIINEGIEILSEIIDSGIKYSNNQDQIINILKNIDVSQLETLVTDFNVSPDEFINIIKNIHENEKINQYIESTINYAFYHDDRDLEYKNKKILACIEEINENIIINKVHLILSQPHKNIDHIPYDTVSINNEYYKKSLTIMKQIKETNVFIRVAVGEERIKQEIFDRAYPSSLESRSYWKQGVIGTNISDPRNNIYVKRIFNPNIS